ncbi:MAG: hypothetical protein KKF12_14165 [Proteobacteria bacterium]|nr:hypothetical protein [Desulfobacula sp.]MBU3953706.1 hypothetical protein [Pseudomonadota bacterium]MBU4131961.1 hypothetical protein [Pseudomonadota bacterium]
MPKTRKENPFLIGMSENDIMQTYGSSDQRQSNLLDITNYSAHIKNRSFDLDLQREYRSPPKKNESTGYVLDNKFSGRFKLYEYGILFEMLLSGAVRYERDKNAHIIQTWEHTIECVTAKDGVVFDVYFFWEGMCGTNSSQGWANFGINLSVRYKDGSGSLSEMDGISCLGAKTCKGNSKLIDNFVKKKGTPVTFVIRYEMDLAANSDPLAISEVRFDKPANTYFKIVTK